LSEAELIPSPSPSPPPSPPPSPSPRRSHPAQPGEGSDAPPTLERSGSERRVGAVTSLSSEERGLGGEVEPPLRVREDGWVFEKANL